MRPPVRRGRREDDQEPSPPKDDDWVMRWPNAGSSGGCGGVLGSDDFGDDWPAEEQPNRFGTEFEEVVQRRMAERRTLRLPAWAEDFLDRQTIRDLQWLTERTGASAEDLVGKAVQLYRRIREITEGDVEIVIRRRSEEPEVPDIPAAGDVPERP